MNIGSQNIYKVSKEVVYDHQQLMPGEKIKRINEWKENPDGYFVAQFAMWTGDTITLFRDEVTEE